MPSAKNSRRRGSFLFFRDCTIRSVGRRRKNANSNTNTVLVEEMQVKLMISSKL
jgi:hypothetical protein